MHARQLRESGVRELEKKINKVMRKIALEFARDGYEVMHEICNQGMVNRSERELGLHLVPN